MPSLLTEAEIKERLERRVLGPEGQGHKAFLFFEVEIDGSRADAVSIGLWASRGQLIEGYEIKTNRGDWLRELEHPEKADPIVRASDRFWLVANPDVIGPGELPENWGLILTNGRRRHLKAEKEAPALEKSPVSHRLLATLLRRSQADALDNLHDRLRAARDEGEDRAKNLAAIDGDIRERHEKRIAELEGALNLFREAAGLNPFAFGWRDGREAEEAQLFGTVVRALREGEDGLERMAARIRDHESTAADLSGRLNEALGALNEAIYGKGQAA